MPIQIPIVQVGLEASIQQAMQSAGKNSQINLGINSRQISSLSQPLGRITGQADDFTKSMEAANARVFAFGASVGIINTVTRAFGSLVKSTIQVEKALVDINTVLGTNADSLQKFGSKLFDVAKSTGQSFDTVAKGALELARQGLGTEETLKRINDALILSRLSGLDAAASVEGLTAAYNSFKSTGITTSEILNKLVVVSQKYAVSERDLIEGIKRSASVADQAGVSFDELVGIITTVQERTARGGAVIGNAFKTIFARIQDTGALDDLRNLGIEVNDVSGKILPATSILQNLAKEFKNLSQTEQSDISKKLGGVYQLSNLLAAVKDLSSEQSKYGDIVRLSAGASNEAYKKNAALNQTLASLINKVTVSAEQLGATLGAIGVSDNLKNLLGFFNSILEGIQSILGEESKMGDFVRGLAKGIGGILAGPGLALFGAVIAKLGKDLIQFGFGSLKSFFQIGQAAKDIQNVEKAIASALGSNLSLQKQIFALEGNRAGQLKLMTDAIVMQEAAMRRMSSTSASMAVPLYQSGVRSKGGQGLRIPTAAGGYTPVGKEAGDISRGVGGARSGDKPVVIPNFSFGNGKKGTMVANSGEYIIPNFAGGGSAIFNRNMVKSMGLPDGAQKINASGGFIPSFAAAPKDFGKYLTSRELSATSVLGYKKGGGLDTIWSKDINGLRSSYESLSEADRRNIRVGSAQEAQLKKTATGKSNYGIIYPDATGGSSVTNLLTPAKNNVSAIPIQTKPSDFLYKDLRDGLVNSSLKYAQNLGFNPDIVDDPTFKKLVDKNLNAGSIEAAYGTVFEAAFQAAIGSSSKPTATWDLPNKSSIGTLIGKMNSSGVLGSKSSGGEALKNLSAADFKNALNLDNLKSIDSKILASSSAKAKINTGSLRTSASGYIPNFANPLKEAISREVSAGVDPSQVYIDQNSSLKNFGNPMGLMVANRRDEPQGGIQGINRARKEGANAQMYGSAGGFVPNFAAQPLSSFGGSDESLIKQIKPQKDLLGVVFALQAGLSGLSAATSDATSTLGKYTNITSDALSAGTTATFAFQGLSAAIPKFAGFLGPAGLAIGGLISAWKLGTSIYNEQTGINKIVAKSLETVGEAASKASVNLDSLSGTRKSEVKKTAEDIVTEGLKTGLQIKTTDTSLSASMGNALAERSITVDESSKINSTLKENLNQITAQAKGAGVSTALLTETIKKLKGETGYTIDSIDKIRSSFSGFISDITKLDLEIKKLNINPTEGIGASMAGTNKIDFEKQLTKTGEGDPFADLRKTLSTGGVTDIAEQNDRLRVIYEKVSAAALQAQSDQVELGQSVSKQLKDTIKQLSLEASIRSRMNTEQDSASRAEFNNLNAIAGINSDLSLSETDKSKKLKDQEVIHANIISQLEIQKQLSSEIDEITSNLGQSIKESDRKNAIESSKKFINQFRGTQAFEEITGQVKSGNVPTSEALTNAIRQSSEFSSNLSNQLQSNVTFVEDLVASVLKLASSQGKLTDGAALENSWRIKNNIEAKNSIDLEKQRVDLLSRINQFGEAQAGLGAVQGTINQGRIQGLDTKKQIDLTKLERFGGVTKESDLIEKQRAIQDKYFNLTLKAQEAEDRRQLDIETERKLYTQDNISALLQNTKAVEGLPDLLFKAFSSSATGGNNSIMQSGLSGQAQSALNNPFNDIFKNINGQADNCGKVINTFAKSLNISTVGATDVANSFQKVGTAIDKSNIKPGDILINSRGKGADETGGHVGMYLGNNKVLQASQSAYNAANPNSQGGGRQNAAITAYNPNSWDQARRPSGLGSADLMNPMGAATTSVNSADAIIKQASQYQAVIKSSGEVLSKISDPAKLWTSSLLEAKKRTELSSEAQQKLAENIQAYAIGVKNITAKSQASKEQNVLENQLEDVKNAPSTFSEGMTNAFLQMDVEQRQFAYNIGKEIPKMFSTGISSAINQAIEGTATLKDALKSAAYEFVKALNQKMMGNFVDKITSNIGGSFFGGNITTAATGGMINGGSGNKDDIPAMLMGGEYVVNKKAVQKYGPDFLHSINNGKLNGYAKGGVVNDLTIPNQTGVGGFSMPGMGGAGSIVGKENLLAFATQQSTSGARDIISSGNGASYVNLEAESQRLTQFGRSQDVMSQGTQAAKEQAFGLYTDQLNQELEHQKQLEEYRKQKKAQQKAFRNQMIMMAVSIGAGAVASAGASGFKAAFAASKATGGTLLPNIGAGMKGIFTGGMAGGQSVGGLGNLFGSAGKFLTGDFKGASSQFDMSQIGSADQLSKSYTKSVAGDGRLSGFLDKNGYIPKATTVNDVNGGTSSSWFSKMFANSGRKAVGGSIPETSGVDTIPTMLSGGEFIMNRAASKNIGSSNLQSLNSGGSSLPTEEKSEELNDKLIAKLDELIESSGKAGNITINVDGSTGKSSEDKSGADDRDKNVQMARVIRDMVVKVIQDEKRLGGSLRK